MTIVISDVHGCFNTLQSLLSKLPDDKIFFVGDLVDKGPRSAKVVQFLMDHPEMQSVRGNHEDFMLDTISNCTYSNYNLWTHPRNGGDATLESYRQDYPALKDREVRDMIPKEHQFFIDSLPQFLIEGDLFISHSGYSGFDLNDQETLEDMETWDKLRSLRWYRGAPKKVVKDGKEYFHIFGHTPTPEPIITDFYANIDTGCFLAKYPEYVKEGYGYLTAIQYPSMRIWKQEYVD